MKKVLISLGVALGLIIVSNAVLFALAGNIETWRAAWETWLGIFSPVWIVIGVIVYWFWWRRRKGRA